MNGYAEIPGGGLCRRFQKESCRTWSLLERGRNCGAQLLEETISNLLVLSFRSKEVPGFAIHSYSKTDEGKIGADYEWWFRSRHRRVVGLRMQAKVVHFSTDSYRHLHQKYRKPRSGIEYQADHLIANALTSSPARLPLYCLYTHWNHSHFGKRHGTFGCLLLSPYRVKALRATNANSLKEVLPYTLPWHCLTCYRDPGEKDIADQVTAIAKRVILSDQMVIEARRDDYLQSVQAFMTSEELPTYVQMIAQVEEPNVEDEDLAFVTFFDELAR